VKAATKKVKHLQVPPVITGPPNGVQTYNYPSRAYCGARTTPSIATRDAKAVTCDACRARLEAVP